MAALNKKNMPSTDILGGRPPGSSYAISQPVS